MKIGVKVKIDVTKIDKTALFKGKKGTYLDAVTFINIDEQGQFGDNGMITQELTKAQADNGDKGEILGNVTVFWRDDQGGQSQQPASQKPDDQPNQFQCKCGPGQKCEICDIPF